MALQELGSAQRSQHHRGNHDGPLQVFVAVWNLTDDHPRVAVPTASCQEADRPDGYDVESTNPQPQLVSTDLVHWTEAANPAANHEVVFLRHAATLYANLEPRLRSATDATRTAYLLVKVATPRDRTPTRRLACALNGSSSSRRYCAFVCTWGSSSLA